MFFCSDLLLIENYLLYNQSETIRDYLRRSYLVLIFTTRLRFELLQKLPRKCTLFSEICVRQANDELVSVIKSKGWRLRTFMEFHKTFMLFHNK